MSGGSFDYAYNKVNMFVEVLNPELEYSQEVMRKIREIADIANNTAQLMRAVEWLYSGDDSEQSFLKNVVERMKCNDEKRESAR